MAAPPEELSGGEQQRVAVARALAGRPEILLADEPTSNLDRRSARELIDVFRELHDEGLTLVIATHDAELLALATRVVELEHGRLVGPGG
jgi:putative ABC transport system ATP-binding protein